MTPDLGKIGDPDDVRQRSVELITITITYLQQICDFILRFATSHRVVNIDGGRLTGKLTLDIYIYYLEEIICGAMKSDDVGFVDDLEDDRHQ